MNYIRKILLVIFTLFIGGSVWGQLPTPQDLWKDFDPDQGDFKEEIIYEGVREGIYYKDAYISAYVNGEEVRVYCKYAVKDGLKKAPALLDVHGWMSQPHIDMNYVNDGWAVLAHDYCGKTGDRPHYTKYPESLKYGNIDNKEGYRIKNKLPDGSLITDPKQTDDYLWYVLQRRALSYLYQQKEIDTDKIGAKGYSYGGTLMWNLGMDKRIKAFVAYFGIGYLQYWRNKQVWLYNNPYKEPSKDAGDELYLSSIAPQAHAPYIQAPALWLSGTNDHHGGHERSEQIFKSFQKDIPWDFALQARGHHNTEKLGDDAKVWLEKYVMGTKHFWPKRPTSKITLDDKGVPQYTITPSDIEKVKNVKIYYALKDPVSYTRSWRDTEAKKVGNSWVASLPVLNIDDYVFAYSNIHYQGNIVISGDFEAAIPSKLGNAIATDELSTTMEEEAWTKVAQVEGVGGIMAIRPYDNNQGTVNENFTDPKYVAPKDANLNFLFYCTQPQSLSLVVNDHYKYDLEITASNEWQQIEVLASDVRYGGQPLGQWSKTKKIAIRPKEGSDLTKVLFSNFSWEKKTIEEIKAEAKKQAEANQIKGKRLYLTSKNAAEKDTYWRILDGKSVDGQDLMCKGKRYDEGLGVHAPSKLTYEIKEGYKHFYVTPLASESHHGKLTMKIYVDGNEVYNSGVITSTNQEIEKFDIDVKGSKSLTLVVEEGENKGGDHANWIEPFFIVDESVEIESAVTEKKSETKVAISTVVTTSAAKTSIATEVEKGTRVYLTQETMKPESTSYWKVNNNMSVRGEKLTMNGKVYEKGLGVHAPSKISYAIPSKSKYFYVTPGADDAHTGSVRMRIEVDGKEMYNSGLISTRKQDPKMQAIEVAGGHTLTLIVEDDGDRGGDHADWADAFFVEGKKEYPKKKIAIVPETDKTSNVKGDKVFLTKEMATSTESFWRVMNDLSIVGKKISINGETYEKGLGVHSDSKIVFPIKDSYKSFVVTPGANDSHHGLIRMRILVDGNEVYNSGPLKSSDQSPKELLLDVKGRKELTLIVDKEDDNNGGDHASWGNAFFLLTGGAK
ncbi:NPCBM/NEW2 domain-containing protein [Flammeovirga agarivorans]|uniref:Prolyl oligopeptidase family serine peptidase n=1 Tax=Flammeovirga agarivorans TaxID=2726742 RepID=A0A7X8SN74_9BACT|nr:NPCBM/NEW2 domain-containing protein [Flammeovirga agarivorans]NLR93321.1 prolyl oligopeptidase family serine peptidase [Flammeovirga agarivorans]